MSLHAISAHDLDFLLSLRRRGVILTMDGTELLCSGPEKSMTPEVAREIRQRKNAILAYLAAEENSLDRESPVLDPAPEDRYLPFGLTETQQAYWIGRSAYVAGGSTGIHFYYEIEIERFDPQRFQNAWRALLERHDMLHAVVLPDGRQQALAFYTPPPLEEIDLRPLSPGDRETALAGHRAELSHACYDLSIWPQYAQRVFRLTDEKYLLLWSHDLWTIDGHSAQLMISELADLYQGRELPKASEMCFRDYIRAMELFAASPAYERQLRYWRERLDKIPGAPALPLNRAEDAKPLYKRHLSVLEAGEYARLAHQAAKNGITPAALLLACYSEALGHWSQEKIFTVSVPHINRRPLHEDIEKCIGEFANFLLTGVDVRADRPFRQKAQDLMRRMWEDLQHGDVHGVKVLRDWRQHAGHGQEVGFPYVFTCAPELSSEKKESRTEAANRLGRVVYEQTQTPQVLIDAQYEVFNGALMLSWDVRADVFPAGLTEKMFTAYCELLRSLAADESVWDEPAPLYNSVEQDIFYSVLSGPYAPVSPLRLQMKLDERARAGQDMALADQRGIMNWAEVAQASERLRRELIKAGVLSGDRVALLVDKGRWQTIGATAVYEAGGVYVPLDPGAPPERLASLLEDCGACLLLCDAENEALADGLDCPTFFLDRASHPDLRAQARALKQNPDLSRPLFSLIYTSGSTGRPKGVMLTPKGISNVAGAMAELLASPEPLPCLAVSPHHHDMALTDLVGHVFLGMPLIFPEPARKKDPQHWCELMQKHKVRFWNSVPAMMTMLADYYGRGIQDLHFPYKDVFGNLRGVFLGGDWISLDTARRILEWAPQAHLYSIGGPTETTLWNILHKTSVEDLDKASIPYGKPIRNTTYLVTDHDGMPLPQGIAGELCCIGRYMSAGYWMDSERTEKSFSFRQAIGGPMYRTGDMGRLAESGEIEFLGRKDAQIKIGGYRVEPGEIESMLQSHPLVKQAIVFKNTGSLIAWVTLNSSAPLTGGELRDWLSSKLPSYMLPSNILLAERFPLTANDKLDRKTVAAWPVETESSAYVPKTPLEQQLLEAWEEVLQKAPASKEAHFFRSGGDSILAMRLVNSLAGRGYPGLGILTVFQYPTFSLLCDSLGRGRDKFISRGPKLPPFPAPRKRVICPESGFFAVPATHCQARFWVDEQVSSSSGIYNLPFRIDIEGELPEDAVKAALCSIASRHPAFRTTFHSESVGSSLYPDVDLWQHVHDTLPVQFTTARVACLEDEKALNAIHAEMTARPFDLAGEMAMRSCLVRTGDPRRSSLLIVIHHAITDGWSMKIFMEDFKAALDGEPLQPSPVGMAEFAEWEQTPAMRDYIRKRVPAVIEEFQETYPLSLFPKGVGDTAVSPDSPEAHSFRKYLLSADLSTQLRAMAKERGVTEFVFLYAVFAVLLSRYVDSGKMTLGTFAAQRYLPEFEEIIGSLVNPAPLQLDLSGARSFTEALEICSASFRKVLENDIVPFDAIVHSLQSERLPDEHPVFNVGISQDAVVDMTLEGGGRRLSLVVSGFYKATYDLGVSVYAMGNQLGVCAAYRRDRCSDANAEALLERSRSLLELFIDSPRSDPAKADLCTGEDRKRLAAWQDGPAAPAGSSLWERFSENVKAAPHALCLTFYREGQPMALSRAHMERYALHLADRMLRTLGVDSLAGKRILLHLPRGPELTAAMLAVLRGGGAFVPAGMNLPSRRLLEILETAKADLVIGLEGTPLASMDEDCRRLLLPACDPGDILRLHSGEEGQRSALPGDPACLIFTSGSTGKSKGVVLSYQTLGNRTRWGAEILPFDESDICCMKTDINFVDSVTEILTPLLHGGRLHVLPEESTQHMDELYETLETHDISRLVIVPSALRGLVAIAKSRKSSLPALRCIISSGEPLPVKLARETLEIFSARLFNFYGSAELCGEAAWHEVKRQDLDRENGPDSVPIGKPIAGTRVCLMDSRRTVLPPGIQGEICVSGLPLSLGYLDEAGEITRSEQIFFHKDGRLYFATGDLGVWTGDGELLYLGRADRQIKMRGQRIAPQEIEARLLEMPGVAEAAVICVEEKGLKEIHAVIVPDAPDRMPSMEDVRFFLSETLSPAFIPSRLKELATLPRTSSGKTDYAALTRKSRNQRSAEPIPVTPANAGLEEKVLSVYRRFLSPRISLDGNFFDAGGHSLLAVELAVELGQELDVALLSKDVFEYPVIRDMAEHIRCSLSLKAPEQEPPAGS